MTLRLIRHEKCAGSDAGRAWEWGKRPLFHPRLSLSTVLRRWLLPGLLLGLMGFLPAPSLLLPWLTPALEAQANRGRIRAGANPVAMPRAPSQEGPTATAQPAPSASAAPVSGTAATPSAGGVTAAFVNGLPPSLLDQPPQPAKVEFSAKSLSIQADNSSLGAILHEIASKSGMKMEGFSGDERVFGSFGPGAPREVLDDLLNGTPYDLVMVGDLSNGAPRQLILSPSSPGGPTPPSAQEVAAQSEEYAPPPPSVPEAGRTMAPGANPQQVRTPQQMLQELRDRQQQGPR